MTNAIVERARALVGCRFRPQGREPAFGLDCVGVACCVYGIPAEQIPSDYRLRFGDEERLRTHLARSFRKVRVSEARPGDLIALRAGQGQLHLAVLSERGFIHADARLRKVVETPGAPHWPILSMHRLRRKLIEK